MYDRSNEPIVSCGAERQSQVSEQMARGSMLMETLNKSILTLGEKIRPILADRDVPPTPAPANSPKCQLVQLAQVLKDRNDHLESQIDTIVRYIRDIEL